MPRLGSIETEACLALILERLDALSDEPGRLPDASIRAERHDDADRLLVEALGTLAEAGEYTEQVRRIVAAWERVGKAYC